jgi:hypothetical protein
VTDWFRLEDALLQPEGIFRQAFGRRRDKLVTGLSLGLICLMAYDTTLRLCILRAEGSVSESKTAVITWSRTQATDNVYVLIMGKQNFELGNEIRPCSQEWLAETRKRMPRGISWRNSDVAVGTDRRRGSLPRKELRAVAIETCLVFRKVRHICKRIVALANFFPVFRGKLVARITRKFLILNMRAVGKLCIVNPRLRRLLLARRRATTRLRGNCPVERVGGTAETA